MELTYIYCAFSINEISYISLLNLQRNSIRYKSFVVPTIFKFQLSIYYLQGIALGAGEPLYTRHNGPWPHDFHHSLNE